MTDEQGHIEFLELALEDATEVCFRLMDTLRQANRDALRGGRLYLVDPDAIAEMRLNDVARVCHAFGLTLDLGSRAPEPGSGQP